jgi:hypothetical protein
MKYWVRSEHECFSSFKLWYSRIGRWDLMWFVSAGGLKDIERTGILRKVARCQAALCQNQKQYRDTQTISPHADIYVSTDTKARPWSRLLRVLRNIHAENRIHSHFLSSKLQNSVTDKQKEQQEQLESNHRKKQAQPSERKGRWHTDRLLRTCSLKEGAARAVGE